MAAIPGEASAKRKCKGKVQDLLGGGLEYWNETDGKWSMLSAEL